MKKILIIILCFLVLIAVTTGKHAQPIAVYAGARAWVGLDRAATHSPVIIAVTSYKPPSDVIIPGKK